MNFRSTAPASILFLFAPVAIMALFAIMLFLSQLAHAAAKREEAKPGDFELKLSADKAEYRVGEPPRLSAIVTNKSGKEVLLVPALDGSDMGRYPAVRFTVTRPQDAPPPEMLGRCGNTNNIQPGDFVRVEKGGSLDVAAAWVAPRERLFNAPGTYTIAVTYDTSAGNKSWYGFMGVLKGKREIDRLLAQVPKLSLKSNEITITYSAKPPARVLSAPE
ncbi:MAG: hypothetical protein KF886_18195 [Candidatus Hydrogenedentes bacterium]|nr:hypothetical protein [Candidatus Hydrogenedentota bacterium]